MSDMVITNHKNECSGGSDFGKDPSGYMMCYCSCGFNNKWDFRYLVSTTREQATSHGLRVDMHFDMSALAVNKFAGRP